VPKPKATYSRKLRRVVQAKVVPFREALEEEEEHARKVMRTGKTTTDFDKTGRVNRPETVDQRLLGTWKTPPEPRFAKGKRKMTEVLGFGYGPEYHVKRSYGSYVVVPVEPHVPSREEVWEMVKKARREERAKRQYRLTTREWEQWEQNKEKIETAMAAFPQ
jgi:hypothetical protein